MTHYILAMDLDRFKSVNDVLGHSAGDETLKLIAGRIKAALRAKDAVARWGGDEFLALLQGLSNDRELKDIIARIVESVERPLMVGSDRVSVGVSIGWAHFPDDGTDMRGLLQVADTRMYQHKRQWGRPAAPSAHGGHSE